MELYERQLAIDLPPDESVFLWGPRKTGKSTLLRQRFPRATRFDLLDTRLMLEFTRAPWRLRERVQALDASARAEPIVIDEVQKAPAVLDEVHGLIESDRLRFVLCGSSARKLKRGRANLLGGRAWRAALHPLVWREIPDFDLLRALNHGLVPTHYRAANHRRALTGYVDDYLKEEVFDEGLTRNVAAFARFFDALAFSHGELLNFSSIARDCGVDSKTVREYFQILDLQVFLTHAFDQLLDLLEIKSSRITRTKIVTTTLKLCSLVKRYPLNKAEDGGLRKYMAAERPKSMEEAIGRLSNYTGNLKGGNANGMTSKIMADALRAFIDAPSVSETLEWAEDVEPDYDSEEDAARNYRERIHGAL